jgi:hypothetical protein
MATTFTEFDPNDPDLFGEASVTPETTPTAPVIKAPVTQAPATAKTSPSDTTAAPAQFGEVDPAAADALLGVEPVVVEEVLSTRAADGVAPTPEEETARLREAYANGTVDVAIDGRSLLRALDYEEIYERATRPDEVGQWLSAALEGRVNDARTRELLRGKAEVAARQGNGEWQGGYDGVWVPTKYKEAVLHEDTGRGMLRQFWNGASMEFGDELTAAVQSAVTDEDYDTIVTRHRARLKQFATTEPTLSLIANVGGAVATGIATAGTGGLISGGRMVATGAKGLLTMETARTAIKAAVFGATENTVTGIGSREGADKFVMDAILEDAAMGAVIGGGIVGVGKSAQVALSPASRVLASVITPAQKILGSEAGGARTAGNLMLGALKDAGIDPKLIQAEVASGSQMSMIDIIAKVSKPEQFTTFMDKAVTGDLNSRVKDDVLSFLNETADTLSVNYMDESTKASMRLARTNDPDEVARFLQEEMNVTVPLTEQTAIEVRQRIHMLLAEEPQLVRNRVIESFGITPNEVFDYTKVSERIAQLHESKGVLGSQLEAARSRISGEAGLTDDVLNAFRQFDRQGNPLPETVIGNNIQLLEDSINAQPRVENSPWKYILSQNRDGGYTRRTTFSPPDSSMFLKRVNAIKNLDDRRNVASKVFGVKELDDGTFVVRRDNPQPDGVPTNTFIVREDDFKALPNDLRQALDADIANSPEAAKIATRSGKAGETGSIGYLGLEEGRINGSELREAVDRLGAMLPKEGMSNINTVLNQKTADAVMAGLNASDSQVAIANREYTRVARANSVLDEINKLSRGIKSEGSGLDSELIIENLGIARENQQMFNTVMMKYFQGAKYLDDLLTASDETLNGLAVARKIADPNAPDPKSVVDEWKLMGEQSRTVQEKAERLLTLFGAEAGKSPLLERMSAIAQDIDSGNLSGGNIETAIGQVFDQVENMKVSYDTLKQAIDSTVLPRTPENVAALAAIEGEITKLSNGTNDAIGTVFTKHVTQIVHGLDAQDLDQSIRSMDNLLRSQKATDSLLRGFAPADIVELRKGLITIQNTGKALRIIQESAGSLDVKDFSFVGASIEALGITAANLGGTNPAAVRGMSYLGGRIFKTAASGFYSANNIVKFDSETRALLNMLSSNADTKAVGRYFMPLITQKPAKMSMQEFMEKEVFTAKAIRTALTVIMTDPTEIEVPSQASE